MRIVVLAWLLVLAIGAPARAQEAVGEIERLSGTARLFRGGETLVVTVGTPVRVADRVRTDADGRVRIAFVDGSVVTIGSDSELTVASYAADDDGGRQTGILSGVLGAIRAVVTPGGGAFEVQTYTAVASVRSTDWMVDATPEGTAVFVVDGTVEVAGRAAAPGTSVVLEPGEGTDVPAGGGPSAPVRWGAPRIEALMQRTQVP